MLQRPLVYQLRSRDQVNFVHIPKTAGTTFYAILSNQFPEFLRCPPDAGPLERIIEVHGPQALERYKVLRSHQSYDVYRLFSHKPVFVTMLRDPVERIISVYEHIRRVPTHWLHKEVVEEGLDLEAFIEFQPANPIVDNRQVRHLVGDPRTLGMECPTQDLLRVAMYRLEEFAFFGIVENFDASVQLLCYTFGWAPVEEYEDLNVSPRPARRENYTRTVIESIEQSNRLDMALYAHAKRLFAQRMKQMESELVADRKLVLRAHGKAVTPLEPIVEERAWDTLAAQIVKTLSRARQRWFPAGSKREQVYLRIRRVLFRGRFDKKNKHM